MTTNDLKQFYETFREDSRNVKTPFKAIIPGSRVRRFRTAYEAMEFFRTWTGRCLISQCTNTSVKFLAYKFSDKEQKRPKRIIRLSHEQKAKNKDHSNYIRVKSTRAAEPADSRLDIKHLAEILNYSTVEVIGIETGKNKTKPQLTLKCSVVLKCSLDEFAYHGARRHLTEKRQNYKDKYHPALFTVKPLS